MKVILETNWCIRMFVKDTIDSEQFIPMVKGRGYSGTPANYDVGLFAVLEHHPNLKSKLTIDHKNGKLIFEDGKSGKNCVMVNNISTRNGTFNLAMSKIKDALNRVDYVSKYINISSNNYIKAKTYNYYSISVIDKDLYDSKIQDDIKNYFIHDLRYGTPGISYINYFELKLNNTFLSVRDAFIKILSSSDNIDTVLNKINFYSNIISNGEKDIIL